MTRFGKVSQAPTLPTPAAGPRDWDVADLYSAPLEGAIALEHAEIAIDEKLRQAYFWLVNSAILSPFYDIEYQDGPSASVVLGDAKSRLVLPSGQSYSSFVLLPLLNLAVRRRCLLVGGPGRGKTASAILMGVIAGYSIRDVQRAIQHGQPQMTVMDLLGNPLPKDLVNAEDPEQIRIAWRKWLGMRVKIVDEYNRIPTRTQSALLTVMADGYAEVLDQIYECPDSAWYLTANDDAGGGTYQVIEALRDRIDVVVKALHFNPRLLGDLLARMEQGVDPARAVPPEIVFTAAELDRAEKEIRAVVIPTAIRRRLEFFASQFELCEPAGAQFEYKTKDTLKLSNVEWHAVIAKDEGRDRVKDLGSQTKNGLSVRALMTSLVFTKAMAYFRGAREVSLEDVRQILPFVLHDKLVPDLDSPFFEAAGNDVYRVDRIAWIRQLFDLSCAEYDRLDLDRDDPVGALLAQMRAGLEGLDEREVRARLVTIERTLAEQAKGRKLYGPLFDDALVLKYVHQRYTNYLRWLTWRGGAR
ncbi:AAA family ATPase [Sandaracinus amylolyticus]|uniref:ATPase associated with various cellular activity n=1 Tax=Sandaracinus amylolyticus TaxID=927083 RepID=A0A0F6W4E7_9BACT|nr:AAA family ATPase [Sandaracinus amylolyticus]AKF07015.1 ATPase associated with various cellular activity [Sandaracinus amylolyticus]